MPETIRQLAVRRDRLTQMLDRRRSTLGDIGTGAISPLSSPENAIKVGSATRAVRRSLRSWEAELRQMDEALRPYDEALRYQALLQTRHTQLEQIKEMAQTGDLGQDVLAHHQTAYAELASLPDRNPGLKAALTKLDAQVVDREPTSTSASTQSYPPRPRRTQTSLADQRGEPVSKTERGGQLLALLRAAPDGESISEATLAKRLGVSKATIQADLEKLREKLLANGETIKSSKGRFGGHRLVQVEPSGTQTQGQAASGGTEGGTQFTPNHLKTSEFKKELYALALICQDGTDYTRRQMLAPIAERARTIEAAGGVLRRATRELFERVQDGSANPDEREVFDQVTDYMESHDIRDIDGLVSEMRIKLAQNYNRPQETST